MKISIQPHEAIDLMNDIEECWDMVSLSKHNGNLPLILRLDCERDSECRLLLKRDGTWEFSKEISL